MAAGHIGVEGTYVLVSEYREKLREVFAPSFLSRMEALKRGLCILPAAEEASFRGARQLVSVSAGGILAGLWELSKKTGCGFTADLLSFPILQETIEITDFFGIDPYRMRSSGCLLMSAPDGGAMVEMLREKQIPAAVIGKLNKTKDMILCNGEDIRYLDRPGPDTLDLFQKEERNKNGYLKAENPDDH